MDRPSDPQQERRRNGRVTCRETRGLVRVKMKGMQNERGEEQSFGSVDMLTRKGDLRLDDRNGYSQG